MPCLGARLALALLVALKHDSPLTQVAYIIHDDSGIVLVGDGDKMVAKYMGGVLDLFGLHATATLVRPPPARAPASILPPTLLQADERLIYPVRELSSCRIVVHPPRDATPFIHGYGHVRGGSTAIGDNVLEGYR